MQACKDYFILVTSLTNSPFNIFGLINTLYTSIINYNIIYKPTQYSSINKNAKNKL